MNNYSSSNNYESGQSTHVFTSFPDSHEGQNLLDNEDLTSGGGNRETTTQLDQEILNEKKYSLWQIEYYQKYFNVSTNDVIIRIIGSMTPSFNQSYLLNKIRPNPDLYGPFWITSTLIFTIAISGNILSFLSNFGTQIDWHTDFHKVTSSAAAILAYWWLMPTLLYIIMKSRQITSDFEFIEMLCVYGYSLSIYIPVSILWLIHVSLIQWVLVLLAVILSGSVLILTFWPVFSQDENKKVTYSVLISILFFHALLGIGFMLYFFHDVDHSKDIINIITSTQSSTSVASSKALVDNKINISKS